jgi:hypothetical protein
LDISTQDYEKRRTSFELCTWINEQLHELEKEPNFEELYFERKGHNIKQLLEEAIPISKLALYFHRPWSNIYVSCFTDNRDHDAVIEIHRPQNQVESIKIEVTTTEDEASTLRRQALSREGMVFLTGPITRQGRKIISEGDMIDVEEQLAGIIDVTINRIKRKFLNTYDNETAILIYVNSYQDIPHRHRFQVIQSVKELLTTKRRDIYGVYITYSYNFGVDGIRNNYPDIEHSS